jgi:hypothetical protein
MICARMIKAPSLTSMRPWDFGGLKDVRTQLGISEEVLPPYA